MCEDLIVKLGSEEYVTRVKSTHYGIVFDES